MKDKISASRLLPRRSHDRPRDSVDLQPSQSKPSLRLLVRFSHLSQFVTTPSPTSARSGEHVRTNAGGIGIHQGRAASRSASALSSESSFDVKRQSASPLSAPHSAILARAELMGDAAAKPLPPSPLPWTPLVIDIPELPGSILLHNQGLPSVQDRTPLGLSGDKPAPLRIKNSKLECQVPEPSRRSEDSATSQSTSDSPFTKSPASEFEVSPITLHSETTSPSSPYLSLNWRAKAGLAMSGKANPMDVSSETERVATILGQRVQKLEGILRERDTTIGGLHQELQQVKAGRREQVQSSRKETGTLLPTEALTNLNNDNTVDEEQNEVRELRHTVQQQKIEISTLERDILRWMHDVDRLEQKIMWFIEILREPANQETFQSRAFRALESELLEDELIIQPLQPRKRAATERSEPENIPLPTSPSDDDGEKNEPQSLTSVYDDTSKRLEEASIRIDELESKVKAQAEDIRLYKLDVRGYKKDVREREEKIKKLQSEILDLQARLGDEEGGVLMSDIPLGIDLGRGPILSNDNIGLSTAAPPATSYSAPMPSPELPPEPQPTPQEVPKAAIPDTPTPEPRNQQQQQQQQLQSNRAGRQQTHPRTSTRTRHPRFAPIMEETLPDSPTLAEVPVPFTRQWRKGSARDLHEVAGPKPRRVVSMTSMSSGMMEGRCKEGGKGSQLKDISQQDSQVPVQSQQPPRSQLHDPFV